MTAPQDQKKPEIPSDDELKKLLPLERIKKIESLLAIAVEEKPRLESLLAKTKGELTVLEQQRARLERVLDSASARPKDEKKEAQKASALENTVAQTPIQAQEEKRQNEINATYRPQESIRAYTGNPNLGVYKRIEQLDERIKRVQQYTANEDPRATTMASELHKEIMREQQYAKKYQASNAQATLDRLQDIIDTMYHRQ